MIKKTITNILKSAILFGTILILFTSSTINIDNRKEAVLIGSIREILDAYHFSPMAIDDTLSSRSFNLYLSNLDYGKCYLTKEDYKILETYRYKIDEEIKLGTYEFFNLSVELIEKRINEAQKYCEEFLAQPFDFNIDESININYKKSDYKENTKDLKDWWRKNLKYEMLGKISSMERQQIDDKAKNDTIKIKPFEELEQEAREKLKKNYESRFKYINQINRQDRLSVYINSIINVLDPHTGYFPPKDKEDFDISISGQLEGIGATLSSKDGYIKVVQIVPGSASWKQGELKEEDIILKVGQETGEPVDVVDMRLDEAVKLIRGPKGTIVKLTVKKLDGSIKEISIVRDVVIIEETFAKSTIITEQNSNKKIGYLYLPKFYLDFNNANGRKCSDDIKIELEKLKAQNVDGIIFDLRNNGGGSLRDVVTIGGFFIKDGPIVQVKQKNSAPDILRDKDTSVVYSGPLIVMVNSFSASASEILAAAMQDYKRAIIVGTQSSYGKGTVQRFVDIDMFLPRDYNDIKPLGQLKITIEKFYRINGGATQLKGVIPDIILPDKYSYIEIGEKELDCPLAWDEIAPLKYQITKQIYDINKLKNKSLKRQEKDTLLIRIENAARNLKTQRDRELYPLKYDLHKIEDEKSRKMSEEIGKIGKNETGIIVANVFEEQNEEKELDSLKRKHQEDWFNTIKKDEQLKETYNIMMDMIK